MNRISVPKAFACAAFFTASASCGREAVAVNPRPNEPLACPRMVGPSVEVRRVNNATVIAASTIMQGEGGYTLNFQTPDPRSSNVRPLEREYSTENIQAGGSNVQIAVFAPSGAEIGEARLTLAPSRNDCPEQTVHFKSFEFSPRNPTGSESNPLPISSSSP